MTDAKVTRTAASSTSPTTAVVAGSVRALLRVEDLVLFAVALLLYAHSGAGWGLFAALFLVPDLSLLGYLLGPRAGAIAYNAVHSHVGPLLLGAAAMLGLATASLLPLACIWAAHVGFDRALGFGLKYATAFGHTHLGVLGRAAAPEAAPASATVAS